MKIKDKVLIVEDEQSISNFISMILTANGYDTIIVNTGEEALTMISSHCPDLIVLDLGLPDMDGLTVLKHLRNHAETSELPVIMATAKGTEFDKVRGLDGGADDYISKPFGMMEMVSRVKAVLRRAGKNKKETVMCSGSITMDVERRMVYVNDKEVILTLKEFDVLKYMLENKGIVLTRDQLLTHIWGYDFDGETRTVDVHIRTLRSKLGDGGAEIETVRGMGYRIGGRE